MHLAQIGVEVRRQRVEAGLLQAHVAKLSGLSRMTLSQLENGSLNDLGYMKLKAVMDVFGISMQTLESRDLHNALVVAARSISTSYRLVLTRDDLLRMLRTGHAEERFQPHLMALLDETPIPVVVRAVAEAATHEVPAKKIMQHLKQWAMQWKTSRAVW